MSSSGFRVRFADICSDVQTSRTPKVSSSSSTPTIGTECRRPERSVGIRHMGVAGDRVTDSDAYSSANVG